MISRSLFYNGLQTIIAFCFIVGLLNVLTESDINNQWWISIIPWTWLFVNGLTGIFVEKD